ncbi:anaerobic benzoate catabolism transcriptional regulator [compost metagenome]
MNISKEEIDSYKTKLGERITELRLKNELSLRRLAILADMEHHQILNIERGKTDLRLSTILKLSKALNILPKDLFVI